MLTLKKEKTPLNYHKKQMNKLINIYFLFLEYIIHVISIIKSQVTEISFPWTDWIGISHVASVTQMEKIHPTLFTLIIIILSSFQQKTNGN